MIASTRRHRAALGLAAAGAALALSACGADEPETGAEDTTAAEAVDEVEEEAPEVDTSAFNQGPVPSERPEIDEADLPAEPDSSAELSDRIAWEALQRVSTFASVIDPDATSTCPDIAGDEGESVTCTVDYLGEEFEYTIDIESSGILISYDWNLPEGPLVREVLEDTLRFSSDNELVLCDMESDVARGETGGEGPFLCQTLDEATGDVVDWELSISQYGAFSFYRA
ncbi:hypothetical protein [Nocardiopsis sp. MG754419]|uniref:hypothetical protein n=1 Tax=Nocardiopsis sp. MG754419 TaxID=2259865 RepID=UPI001BAA284E|nr:hypothetical protein [Nocardiopsis sp. MG754419]MBR8741662.1 hypothetical protein [Nocardiopsis sp. MG754419]